MKAANNINIQLLERFNKREKSAFGEVYLSFYDELYYFTSRLYANSGITAEDVLQDIFMKIWENNKKFTDVVHLKGYIYLCIRNSFKDFLSHTTHKEKFAENIRLCNDNNVIIESEALSILSDAINLLPEECAKVFKMYLDGWSGEEIAEQLGKSINTIYSQKQSAVKILKEKFKKNSLIIVLLNSL